MQKRNRVQRVSVLLLVVFGLLAAQGFCAEKAQKPSAKSGAPAVKRTPNGLIDDIKKRGKLIVAQVGTDQPPFFWVEKKDGVEQWVGYEIDLARDIAKRLGVDMEILRLGEEYNEVCRVVRDGRADIGISSLSDTPARREMVDFTQPYIVSRVAMLVDIDGLEKAGIEAIEPKDLDDPRVIVALTPNSGYDFVADEVMPRAKRIEVPQGDFNTITKPMLEGKAHALPDDGLTLHLGMTQNPEYASRLHLHVFDEYDDPLSVCLPHNQEALKELINEMIREIEEQEPVTLEYLVEQYMK